MYARMVAVAIDPDHVNGTVQRWREAVAPSVQQRTILISAHLLIERESGRIESIAQGKTESGLQATIVWNREQVARFADLFTVSSEGVMNSLPI